MNKSATRGQETTSTVGVFLPTQAKMALNKTVYHPLITPKVIESVSKTVSAIEKALAGEKKAVLNLAGLLGQLKGEIATHVKESGKPIKHGRIERAFSSFVQVRFKIKNSRVSEYTRLAERKDLHDLDLSLSVLIELSRLKSDVLTKFLKRNPTAGLKKMLFKDIRKLVRDANENRRNDDGNQPVKAESQKKIAQALKGAFDKFLEQCDDETTLDHELESVLSDISFWYGSRKRVA